MQYIQFVYLFRPHAFYLTFAVADFVVKYYLFRTEIDTTVGVSVVSP